MRRECAVPPSVSSQGSVAKQGSSFTLTTDVRLQYQFRCDSWCHTQALIFPVFLLMKPKMLHILSTSIVGSYLFMFGLDYFLGSGLDDIVFNVFKRVTSTTFNQNYAGNFFGKDFNGCTDAALNLGMTIAWVVLTLTSVAMQYKVTAKDLPFPKSSHPNFTQRYVTTLSFPPLPLFTSFFLLMFF